MNIGRACTLLALCLVAAGSSPAQQRDSSGQVLFGPVLGMNWGWESGRIPIYAFSSECGEFRSGTTRVISGGAILSFPSLFSDNLGLSLGAGVAWSTGRFIGQPAEPTSIVDGNRLIRLEREYYLDHEFFRADLDVLGTLRPFTYLELGAGLTAGFIPSISFTQTDNILGPEDYSFLDGQRSHVMDEGKIAQLRRSGAHFGPKLHIASMLPMGRELWMQPALTAQADLLSPVQDLSWQRISVGARLAVLFNLAPAPDTAEPPADIPPAAPLLNASIELYGIDAEGNSQPVAAISVDERLYRQHTPLLPLLYFDRDAASLPVRYRSLTPAATYTFSLDSLGVLGIMEMQLHALDIIGFRLRNDSAATITLAGSTSREESPSLARSRAETVRSYLIRAWGISPSRIVFGEGAGRLQRSSEATEDGRADNRHVEIVSRSPGILVPIITEQVVRNFNPPMIRIVPTYEAQAGLKDWTVTISQEGTVITRYSYQESRTRPEPEMAWSIIHDRIDSELAPLVAELTVEDSTGNVATSRTQIALVLLKQLTVIDGRVEREGDREHIGHTLVAFDYNSPEPGAQHMVALEAMARDVRNGARIAIVGYADRIGDERYNAGLSLSRAQRVADVLRQRLQGLGITDVTITTTGAGIESERFSNDLPEGRALSRGVLVTIEQKPLEVMDK